jgi:hypothetical protein
MSQHAQGFAVLLFLLPAGHKVLALRVGTQEERGRFGKGPLEGRVADFFP